MKTLRIHDKFSIVYDEHNNRPLYVERNGLRHSNIGVETPNWIISMFYSLLEYEQQRENVRLGNIEIKNINLDNGIVDYD